MLRSRDMFAETPCTSQNEGLSPSFIALSFDGFDSISWHSVWFFFSAHIQFSQCFFGFPTFSARVLSSRNAHLVHQNWYRISFTCNCVSLYRTSSEKYHFINIIRTLVVIFMIFGRKRLFVSNVLINSFFKVTL
jgi:hypothetical protein